MESIIRAFFATSNPSLPQTLYMRFVLGLWIVGAVFITVHIQTKFIAIMTKPSIVNEIKTQEELMKSSLTKITGDM